MISSDTEPTPETLTTDLGSFRQKPIEPDEDPSGNAEVETEENVVSVPSVIWDSRNASLNLSRPIRHRPNDLSKVSWTTCKLKLLC